MTMREAVEEAHRRCGHDEARVRDAFMYADMANPQANTNVEIPTGFEEEVIRQILLMFRSASQIPPALLRKKLRTEDKKRQESN